MFGFGSSNKSSKPNKFKTMINDAKEKRGLGPSSAPSVENEMQPQKKKKNMMKSAVGSLFGR